MSIFFICRTNVFIFQEQLKSLSTELKNATSQLQTAEETLQVKIQYLNSTFYNFFICLICFARWLKGQYHGRYHDFGQKFTNLNFEQINFKSLV